MEKNADEDKMAYWAIFACPGDNLKKQVRHVGGFPHNELDSSLQMQPVYKIRRSLQRSVGLQTGPKNITGAASVLAYFLRCFMKVTSAVLNLSSICLHLSLRIWTQLEIIPNMSY